MSQTEPEPQRSMKRVTWQGENCLACVWFSPNDAINADIMERGKCRHSKLKVYDLIVSGRDWCNLFTEIRQKQIEILQEDAMKAEESEK
jgi:MinD superfamily P-loop ATPase